MNLCLFVSIMMAGTFDSGIGLPANLYSNIYTFIFNIGGAHSIDLAKIAWAYF